MSWRQDAVEKASTRQKGPRDPRLRVWRSDQLERRCWIKKHVPERLGSQAPGWAAQGNGKETRLWPIEWGSIYCSSVRSPTPSHIQHFQIKWEVYVCKNCVTRLYYCVVMILHASAYEYTTGAHIECRCSRANGVDVIITHVTIKTPNRKCTGGVKDVMPGIEGFGIWKKGLVEIRR